MRDSLDWGQLAGRWEFAASLASRLAHDLSNIFTGVTGFAELSQLQLAPDHPASAYIRDVLTASRRGINLTQRLHVLRNCANILPGPSPVRAALDAAVLRAGDPPAAVEVSWPLELPQVRLAADPLRLVFAELLQNAAEAGAPAEPIRIAAALVEVDTADALGIAGRVAPGPHVRVTFADAGNGIASDLLERILEVPIVTTKSGPRGLGLGIVFRTLFAHDAGFTLGVRAEGGTLASVFLPTA